MTHTNYINIKPAILNMATNEQLLNAMHDYEDMTKQLLSTRYPCRDCEQHFDTLEAHERHRREDHVWPQKYPLENRPM
ncbi:MAG: hypothetical protein LBQ98_03970 [Nitrososphaerota archaeon]|jgi:hypothetical protein|nr:hypothetical protein [Nitrososphaerota archaeon]